ncbi:MAG: DUF58 domain-containing protein [Spirochaetes bacterium]|jgi:hypothetical protein|nr:DUF58 domain-containing protein [Spirochaetota bacterium]
MSTDSIPSRYRWNASGIGVLTSGVALLSVGVIRTEPVSLLLGGGIAVLGAYVALAGLVATALLSRAVRRRGSSPGIVISPTEVFAGSAVEILSSDDYRPSMVAPPGFVATLAGSLRGPGARELRFGIPLSGRRAERRFQAPHLARGSYHTWTASIELRDLLGFSRGCVDFPTELHVRALPAVENPGISLRAGSNVGGERARSPIRRRTDELLETRRYVPGDDIRRVNWKMFARWGELLVRIGEEVPPPRATQHCVLYPGAPGPLPSDTGRFEDGADSTLAGELCDRLVAVFGGYCLALHEEGVGVTAELPESEAPVLVDATEEHRFLRELAAVEWTTEMPLPREAVERHVTVFAAAGAAGLYDYLAALHQQGSSLSVVTVTPSQGSAEDCGPTALSRLLFRSDLDRAKACRWAAQLRRVAQDDRREMRHRGLGVSHVEVI